MQRSLASFALSALLTSVLAGVWTAPSALGQSSVPTLSNLSPSSAAAGGPQFTLTVTGAGFVGNLFNGSAVLWNGSPLSTSFVSTGQLSAIVPAALIATPGSATVAVVNPGEVSSNTLPFTITGAATLTLSSVNPSSATPGGSAFTLAVTGSGFAFGAVVEWNGSPLSTSGGSTQLSAFVPASLIAFAGSASITVVNPSGAVSNALTFPIAAAGTPALISLSPSSTAAGGPAFALTVNGSGFVNGAVVQWNGSALSSSYFSGSQLSAFVPASLIVSAGSASVTVLNPGGAVSNALTFTITGASSLVLSGLSPNFASAGGPAFSLTVTGSGFVNGTVVLWNGSPLSTSSFLNGNQLSAFVPANLIVSPGSASITVQNPGGVTSNSLTFSITSSIAPVLSSLSPSFAAAGGPAFSLTVTGAGFVSGAVVQWNGLTLSSSYFSGNQLSAFVPASLIVSPGSASVTVLDPGGAASNPLTFSISSSLAPSLSSLSPNSASAGGLAFSLTVNGSGFVNGAVVQWNGSALNTGFISANQLGAFVPANLIASSGSAFITVQNPGGASSNTLTFPITASTTPVVTSLSPNSAQAGGPGFTLSVTGSGFVNGAVVQWNGSPLTSGFISATQVNALVPANLIATPGTATVAVVNPNGVASNAVTFSFFGFSTALRVAQIVDGSNWKTLIQVVNLDQVPVTYSFNFWDNNGNPLPVPFVNGLPGTFSGSLPVGGTAFAETPGTATALLQGWAEAAGSGRIGVLAIFRQIVPGRPDAEGTVLGVPSGGRIFLPFDNTNGYVTGVAMANANPTQSLFLSLTFQLENGSQMTGSLSLPPHAHEAFELTSIYPALAGVRGSLEITSSTPDLAVLGLRFSPTNSFTSLGQFQ